MDRSLGRYLSEFNQILGEFRDLDFLIRIRRENFQPQVNMVDHSILLHEWIHYLQFLFTPVGRFVSYLRRSILQMELDLIKESPQPLRVPLLKWLGQKSATSEYAHIVGLRNIVESLYKQWDWQLGGKRWQLYRAAEKMPRIPVNYLSEGISPISLDLDAGAFVFNFPDDSKEVFEIRNLQVLEFMARTAEIDHACMNGYWGQLDGYVDIWDFTQFDYHAPILYLLQQGILSDDWGIEVWKGGFNGLFFPMLVVICQIALMDSIYVVAGRDRDSEEWECGKVSSTETKKPFKQTVDTPTDFSGEPGKTFVKLLHVLGKYDNQDDYFRLMQLAVKGRNTEDWLAVADTLCSMAGVVRYSQMRKLALDKIKMEWDSISGKKHPPLTIEIFRQFLRAEYESAIKAHELALGRPDVAGYPFRLMKELPFPVVVELIPGKLGFGVTPLELKGSISQVQPLEPAGYFWGLNHVIRKLLVGSDLRCFWEDDLEDTLWYCPELRPCSQAQTQVGSKARTGTAADGFEALFGRCTNTLWKQTVTYILQSMRVSSICPL